MTNAAVWQISLNDPNDIPISSAALAKMFTWVKTSVVQPATLAAVIGSDPGTTTTTEKGMSTDIGSEKGGGGAGGGGGGTTTPTTGIETEREPAGMATASQKQTFATPIMPKRTKVQLKAEVKAEMEVEEGTETMTQLGCYVQVQSRWEG